MSALFGPDFITQKYLRQYPNSKRARSWAGVMVHIQTENGVWRTGGSGYTYAGKPDAWIMPFEAAVKQIDHCGPEKMGRFLRAKQTAPAPNLEGYQGRVAAAHHALFHDDPTDIAERRNRFAEEVNEALQAFGMAEDEAIELVRYTWSRPVGQPEKEVGAAMLTLASLCVVAGIDMAACGEADLEKLQRPETIARIRAKRATRHGRGPLPGFDPITARATTEGKDNE